MGSFNVILPILEFVILLATIDFDKPKFGPNLIIVGGGTIPAEAKARFVELAGGKKAKIVVVPTASIDADKAEKRDGYLNQWRAFEPASLEPFHTRDRKLADDPAFAKSLREASAVWFSGGDQNRIIAAYRGTLVEKELHKLLERGGVIGGTSAGAAVMSDVMIQGGRDSQVKIGPGFGFLKGIVVDQHFTQRNRVGRLRVVLERHPHFAGLGIDEGTAVVVRGGRIEIIGVAAATAINPISSPQPKRERKLGAGTTLQLVELLPVRKAA
jgi:cyanophycinase